MGTTRTCTRDEEEVWIPLEVPDPNHHWVGGKSMIDADLTRSTVALYLATIDLFTAPLRVLARSVASAEERTALQQEVWDRWGAQPPPLSEVLFP